MTGAADSMPQDVADYLSAQQRKRLLRFITCGSVDDGKSSLIGRLLYEAKTLLEDQLAVLADESRRIGTTGGELDFALLLDGLSAEREQGITIDVAYRFFATERRKFIVADTPGHEQYTRNMVTGASTADAAVILVDARKGVLIQTRRHSFIASLLGIRHVALAINKMDLIAYSQERFTQLCREYRAFAESIGLVEVTCLPISALQGDNVTVASERTPWFDGPTLLEFLETVQIDEDRLQRAPLRLPIQWVNRPSQDFRGFAGQVASGVLRRGDAVRIGPAGTQSVVTRIVTRDGDLEQAVAGQSVTVCLREEIDVSRGDVLSHPDSAPAAADEFEATVVWMHEQPMLRGRSYLMKIGAKTVTATVMPLKYKINVNTLEHLAATRLDLNEIGVCDLELDRAVAFDPYAQNRATGAFILIDRVTNYTVGAGMLRFALRRSQNVHWQATDVDQAGRARLNGHQPCVLWFTGLSGAGKSTIANLLEKRLHALGQHTYLLDGDNVRHGLNKDLGFTDADRVENIRRVAEVAKLMLDAGLIVLVSFISPFRNERRMARSLVGDAEFLEVFIDTPLALAERRDVKGLYQKARQGQLKNFTGIDSPYETPENPEIRIDTTSVGADEAALEILRELQRRGIVAGE
ncbi:MAG TPA: sulfate adenylyltransferase subunit CysN [Steroidobacteraceae bacterium]|nr:sulfate adenylyltransferase subunit CysN [Steroidobacteraceae bacterium]